MILKQTAHCGATSPPVRSETIGKKSTTSDVLPSKPAGAHLAEFVSPKSSASPLAPSQTSFPTCLPHLHRILPVDLSTRSNEDACRILHSVTHILSRTLEEVWVRTTEAANLIIRHISAKLCSGMTFFVKGLLIWHARFAFGPFEVYFDISKPELAEPCKGSECDATRE